jgi:HEAT repeat protein
LASSIDHLDASHSKLRFLLTRTLKLVPESELFEFVQDSDIVLRTSAARELQMRGTQKGFGFSISLTKSIRFEDREIGAFILGQLAPPNFEFFDSTVGPLLSLFLDPYYEVRAAAVGAFGFLAPARQNEVINIVDKIILLGSDSEMKVRQALACTLGQIHFESAKSYLEIMLEDENLEVSNAAQFSLELQNDYFSSSKT